MAYMIVDSHTHIIRHREPVWGWGPHFTVENLMTTLDREYDVLGETQAREQSSRHDRFRPDINRQVQHA
jgi:hypothetical protein